MICFLLNELMYKKTRNMKKTLSLIIILFLLNGCAETLALLGPASSIGAGSGKMAQSAVTSAVSYGVKKQTGMSPSQHALSYANKNNPNNKKENCIGIKSTNSEACAIANKKAALAKNQVNQTLENKKISFKKMFAEARKEGKNYFIYNSKIYNTSFKKTESKVSAFFNR